MCWCEAIELPIAARNKGKGNKKEFKCKCFKCGKMGHMSKIGRPGCVLKRVSTRINVVVIFVDEHHAVVHYFFLSKIRILQQFGMHIPVWHQRQAPRTQFVDKSVLFVFRESFKISISSVIQLRSVRRSVLDMTVRMNPRELLVSTFPLFKSESRSTSRPRCRSHPSFA